MTIHQSPGAQRGSNRNGERASRSGRDFVKAELKELLSVILAAFAVGLLSGIFFMGQQLGLFG